VPMYQRSYVKVLFSKLYFIQITSMREDIMTCISSCHFQTRCYLFEARQITCHYSYFVSIILRDVWKRINPLLGVREKQSFLLIRTQEIHFMFAFQITKSTSTVVVEAILKNVALGMVALDLEKSNSSIIWTHVFFMFILISLTNMLVSTTQ
jgi:hypothetical protein